MYPLNFPRVYDQNQRCVAQIRSVRSVGRSSCAVQWLSWWYAMLYSMHADACLCVTVAEAIYVGAFG
jgi:hypothetical protein